MLCIGEIIKVDKDWISVGLLKKTSFSKEKKKGIEANKLEEVYIELIIPRII